MRRWFTTSLGRRFGRNGNRPRSEPARLPAEMCLAMELHNGAPYMCPIAALDIGSLLVGPPGTGKSIAQMQMAEGAILGPWPRSIVYIDGKFDSQNSLEIPNALMKAAEKKGLPFKFVTITDPSFGVPTFGFNCLDMAFFRSLSPHTRAEFVAQSCGLVYGPDYGPAFYSSMIGKMLVAIFTNYPRVQTWRQLASIYTSLLTEKEKKTLPEGVTADSVRSAIAIDASLTSLGELDAFNISAQGGNHPFAVTDRQLDVADLFRAKGVVYIGVSNSVKPLLGPNAMRQVVFALSYSSQFVDRQVPVWLFIDEFATAASYSYQQRLNQCRAASISLHLSCQSIDDLVTSAVDLRPNVSNLPLKRTFRIDTPAEQKAFSEASGQTVIPSHSLRGNYGFGKVFYHDSVTLSSQTVPLMSLNDVKQVSANMDLSIMELRQDSAGVQYGGFPVVVQRLRRNDFDHLRQPLPLDYPGAFIPRMTLPIDDPEVVKRAGPVPPIDILPNTLHDFNDEQKGNS